MNSRIKHFIKTMQNKKLKARNLEEYSLIEKISSLTKEDAGRKIIVKGYIRYYFPNEKREAIVVVDQLDWRNGGGHDLRIVFDDPKELQQLFPKEYLGKADRPSVINGKININATLISTDSEHLIGGKLVEFEYYPYIKLGEAFCVK